MPELAEVEYYRKQWDPGLGAKVRSVELRPDKRLFRGTDIRTLARELPGATLLRSEARGKQMAFCFSRGRWIAVHLGMTGQLRIEPANFAAGKHDHLILRQAKRALVFNDPRQFGRVLWFQGAGEPEWWSRIPPAVTSATFTVEVLRKALQRHRKLPLKGALLLQKHFPGVGNWMADEILWRCQLHPGRASGEIDGVQLAALWKAMRFVCRGAMQHVSETFSDPPRDWFYHERWAAGGKCPRDATVLERATIGGRTTAWCAKCQ